MPSATKNLYARFHVRRPTSINFLLPRDKFQNQDFFADGYLVDAVTGAPVPNKNVIISYTYGLWGSDITDVNGYFTAAEASLSTIMTYTFQANFIGDADYLASSSGLRQLTIWMNKYTVVTEVEDKAWAAILCIDPNGVRTTSPVGPIFLLMHSLLLKPGLTDKNGSFMATLNDNANDDHWDMYLIRDGTEYIRDDDEFWIGIQRESYHANNDPENDVWNPSGGSDGRGAGRKWLMGGCITKRSYRYARDTGITAVIRGKCYMDILHTNYFGTPEIPRNYTSPTDFATIAEELLEDLNITSGYTFIKHPTYWPGNGGAPASVGVEWTKEFNVEPDFEIFRNACEEGGWEWRIDHLKQIWLFQRSSGPSTGKYIEYDENIRSIPEIMMGDSTELITHIIITDGEGLTLPADPDQWAMVPGNWLDIETAGFQGGGGRTFSAISYPAPPNHMEGIYADPTLIADQEGNPASCFIKWNEGATVQGRFDLNLSFGYDLNGDPKYATLGADVRKWRRGKLNFRHATRMPDEVEITILDWTQLSGETISVKINNVTTILREGIDWDAAFNNIYTAAQIWSAVNSLITGASASLPGGAVIRINSENGYHINLVSTSGPAPAISIGSIDRAQYALYLMFSETEGYAIGIGRGEGLSHQLVQGFSKNDDVSSREWSELDLMLPQATDEGIVATGNPSGNPGDTYLKGWSRLGGYNGSVINYVRLRVEASNSEADSSKNVSPVTGESMPRGPNRNLSAQALNGKFYITIDNPEVFGGVAVNTALNQREFWPTVWEIIDDGVNNDFIGIDGVHGAFYPEGNTRLAATMPKNYANGSAVYAYTGVTIAFSRFHLSRNMSFTEARDPQLYSPPNRYKLMSSKDIETLSEASSYAQNSLEQEATPRKWVRINLDGDPEEEIGYRIVIRLDPNHNAVFQNVNMTIDDADYVVDGPDFYMRLWLGKTSETAKPREINEFTTIETVDGRSKSAFRNRRLYEKVR